MAFFDFDGLEEALEHVERKQGFLLQPPVPNVPIRCVIFDLFGTLVHMTNKRLPWTRLFGKVREEMASDRLSTNGFDVRTASSFVQTTDGPPRVVATQAVLSQLPDCPVERLEQLFLDVSFEQEVETEAASVTLFDDSLDAIMRLRSYGMRLALVSNLATSYVGALRLCGIHNHFDVEVYSCEEGVMKGKPDDFEIYGRVAARLNISRADCLFVGDTVAADYDGPITAGMQAVHLKRRRGRHDSITHPRPTITSLAQLMFVE